MDPWKMYIFPIQHGDFPACYVRTYERELNGDKQATKRQLILAGVFF